METFSINKVGESKTGTLNTTLSNILEKVGPDNATQFDDSSKVKMSWGFTDGKREAFIWSYKVQANQLENNTEWSVDGDLDMLREIFGQDSVR